MTPTQTRALFALWVSIATLTTVTSLGNSCDCLSVQALRTLVKHQSVTIQTMQGQLTSLQTSVHQQVTAVSDLYAQLSDVNTTLTADLQGVHTRLDVGANDKVAFTAHMSKLHVNVGANAPFIFDAVTTNIGGAYNKNSGIFIAPYDGVYVFNFIMVNDGDAPTIHAVIEKDGTRLGVGTSDGLGASNKWDDGSALVTTHLVKGSHVYVKRRDGGTQLYGDVYTNFSGFLLSLDV